MKYLLDTHYVLWLLTGDERSSHLVDMLSDQVNTVFFSSASIWEIAIKHAIGKIPIPPVEAYTFSIKQDLIELPITAEHTCLIDHLNKGSAADHNDPFDNILVAQAKAEGAKLITADRHILLYGEPCVWRA